MKKPFLFALVAAVYIVVLVLAMQTAGSFLPPKDNILMPIAMLGIFVLSASVMGFLFLSEPLKLYLDNKKQEAVAFFAKTVGFFACFVIVFVVLVFII